MKTYNVKFLSTAEADIDNLADFLFENLSRESAYPFKNDSSYSPQRSSYGFS